MSPENPPFQRWDEWRHFHASRRKTSKSLDHLSRLLRSFQYRLYPTKKQEARLYSQFHLCTELHNLLRSQCKEAFEQTGKDLTRFKDDVRLPREEAIVVEAGTRYSVRDEVGRPRL